MAQVIIDYDEYQRLLKSDTNLAGAKMEIAHLKAVICKFTKEKALIEAELATLKAMEKGY